MVGWSWGIGGLGGDILGVLSSALIGDIGDISIISIAGVANVLDSAIGKSNRVGSLDIAGSIRGLLSVEGSLGVVISDSVGVGVGGDLIGVGLSMVSWSGGVVGWSSVDSVGNNWSSVDSVSNRVSNNWSVDSMGNWGMDSVGSYHRGSVGDHSGSNMWSKVSRVRDNSSNTDGSMVSNIRSGGSSSQTKESRDDESLHFCSVTVQIKLPM